MNSEHLDKNHSQSSMKVHVTALELGIATQIEVLESIQDPIRHKSSSNQFSFSITLEVTDKSDRCSCE